MIKKENVIFFLSYSNNPGIKNIHIFIKIIGKVNNKLIKYEIFK